jgi:hypothetical protein
MRVCVCVFLSHSRGADLNGNTVGRAFVGTMCSESTSVGLSQDGRGSVDAVASTAAHELGHIFSMEHDESEYGMCMVMNGVWV